MGGMNKFGKNSLQSNFHIGGHYVPEVHKVPEPENLVRRKFWKISLLAENFDQKPLVEKNRNFSFTCLFHYPSNFSAQCIILTETTHSYGTFSVHIILTETTQSFRKCSVHILLT